VAVEDRDPLAGDPSASLDEAAPDPEVDAEPLDEFWGADALDTTQNADALAQLLDHEHDEDEAARATRSYMGAAAGEDEREALARWAEGKACKGCRRTLLTTHDPARLRHDDCRSALRVARLLSRNA
jgi:hypothetical protein